MKPVNTSRLGALLLLSSVTLIGLQGCADIQPHKKQSYSTQPIALLADSTLAGELLSFLNASTTSFTTLDEEVGLDRRTATHLIAYRNGADEIYGTDDDEHFSSVEEVDAVPWVGPRSLEKLAQHIQGWLDAPQIDLVAEHIVEGVSFSDADMKATLFVANSTSAVTLDTFVALDHRAVQSMLDARPIETIDALAELYYVGPSALTALKQYARHLYSTTGGNRSDCTSDAICAPGTLCVGRPEDGTTPFGQCTDITPITGQGAGCSNDLPCQEDLVCAGLMMSGAGQCIPTWMTTIQETSEILNIPDGNANGISSEMVVYGLGEFVVDIMVRIDVLHDTPEDLTASLIAPDGQEMVLGSVQDIQGKSVLIEGLEDNVTANGAWSLHVADTVGGEQGVLLRWLLQLTTERE